MLTGNEPISLIDTEVMKRYQLFRCQLISAIGNCSWPRFQYRQDVPLTFGKCYSCGDDIGQGSGRCQRCSIAWRLAMHAEEIRC